MPPVKPAYSCIPICRLGMQQESDFVAPPPPCPASTVLRFDW
uniref:Uncharacterized protein n=1 Tax=Rhizophora mucronata TaxID=61149 RepID=A0A2P2QAS8_RHIMU